MGVNSIGFFGFFGGTPLSESTIRKLRALGIDPKYVKSESEALILIKNATKKQNVKEVETFEQKMLSEAESELKNSSDTILKMMEMNACVNRLALGL